MIREFREEYRFLSNFVPARVEFEGREYISVEHAYVASKTLNDVLRFEISAIPTAGKAKEFGKFLDLRPDWEEVRVDIMRSLLKQKFNQAPYEEALISTGKEELVEGNKWHDNFWGSCICVNCGDKGKNMLGKLLMEIRGDLRQQKLPFPIDI